jgi:hypothetical protein
VLKDVTGIVLNLLVECPFKPKGGGYVARDDTLRTLG